MQQRQQPRHGGPVAEAAQEIGGGAPYQGIAIVQPRQQSRPCLGDQRCVILHDRQDRPADLLAHRHLFVAGCRHQSRQGSRDADLSKRHGRG